MSKHGARRPRRPADVISQRETWHRTGGGGTLRASVFGVSDGLVSNASLVMGFAGAQTRGRLVLLAGVAGSPGGRVLDGGGRVRLDARPARTVRAPDRPGAAELEASPEEERREISLIYQAKGVPKEQADAMAEQLMKNPEVALDTLVREELGLDPCELGSPWGAAVGSFLAFAFGAVVPVFPFLFGSAATGVVALSAGAERAGAVRRRRGLSLFTGPQRPLQRRAAAGARRGGGGPHLRHRQRDRRLDGRLSSRQRPEHVFVVLAEGRRGQANVCRLIR